MHKAEVLAFRPKKEEAVEGSIERKDGMYHVPVGDATLLDNESILSVKERHMVSDAAKLTHVQEERKQYRPGVEALFTEFPSLVPLYQELAQIHGRLWNIEDRKRQIEQGRSEDEVISDLLKPENESLLREYVGLSRQVSLYNDQRASLKRKMNTITGSKIVEVKSHAAAV